jgi:hypothetical protein
MNGRDDPYGMTRISKVKGVSYPPLSEFLGIWGPKSERINACRTYRQAVLPAYLVRRSVPVSAGYHGDQTPFYRFLPKETRMTTPNQTIQHWTTTRLSLPVAAPFDEFRRRYEAAVPVFPGARFQALIAQHVSWDAVIETTDTLAPYGFLLYWINDVTPLMSLAGIPHRCVTYLMGNHTIAERMFLVDPRVMNYAPLRIAITCGVDGVTRFTLDLPSSQFASFHDPAIAEVGHLLDQKVASLLRHLNVEVPKVLTTA